ncbi:MAG TPA: hypothetical protein VH374_26680 [Polyangia bacterium]|jgi:hypothetical protein|nr:hypothetical protein [Polyangia bacterium]
MAIIARMNGSFRSGRAGLAAAALTSAGFFLLVASPVQATAFIYRSIVLPYGEAAADMGVGIGRAPVGPDDRSVTGMGLNLALAGGLVPSLELGVRTGIRFDGEGRGMRADQFGRTWDTETYGTGTSSVANPEVHLRWLVARGEGAQLGLEFRAYFPIESGTRLGFLFGVPLMFRIGQVRVDTGVYVPVLFDPQRSAISIPVDVWIQAGRVWFGPQLGVRTAQSGGSFNQYPLGFGLGYAASPVVDLRTWLLFPDIGDDAGARTWGVGLAVHVRFQ